jgi:hypothetical protein
MAEAREAKAIVEEFLARQREMYAAGPRGSRGAAG